jgi:hypothetical protein
MRTLRPRVYVVMALVAVGLSTAAVVVVAFHLLSPESTVARVAESFASPGELLWWSTIGGAFAGRPTGPMGLTVWALGAALFWFLVFLATAALMAWLRSLGPQHE